MLGFDSLLKFADENHRPVIVSLIGLLMVGGVAGGLVIQNLQTSLAQRDELEKQRITILENTYEARRENLQAQLNRLSARADAYQTQFRSADEDLKHINEELVKLGQTNKPVSSAKIAQLADEVSATRWHLAFMSNILGDATREAGGGSGQGGRELFFVPKRRSSILILTMNLIAMTLILITLILVFGIFRRRRARKMIE